MLIFNSGKIVFTGAKTREQLLEAFALIQPVLRKFKREPGSNSTSSSSAAASLNVTNAAARQRRITR